MATAKEEARMADENNADLERKLNLVEVENDCLQK